MKRSMIKPISIAALALSSTWVLGCGSTGEGEAPNHPGELRSEKLFSPEREGVGDAEITAYWAGQLDVALATKDALGDYSAPDVNFAYSPASVAVAMAMASAGASGNTLSEIESVLQFPEQGTLHDLMAESIYAIQSLNHDAFADGNNEDVDAQHVRLANSIWPQNGLDIMTPFLDTLSESYDVGVVPVDYMGDTEGARQAINDWVEEETASKIDELLIEGTLKPTTRITVVNAIYFKSPWDTVFDEGSTADRQFFVRRDSGIEEIQVPTMYGRTEGRYLRVEDTAHAYEVIELPFGHGDVSMTFVRALCPTNADCGENYFGPLPAESLTHALKQELNPEGMTLLLPKFDIRSKTSLRAAYEAMGMVSPFSGGIDQIVEGKDYMIQDIIHEATVAIDEKGAEAAAATAVVIGDASSPPPIALDSAFWFVIRSNTTRIPLFIGYIGDPSVE